MLYTKNYYHVLGLETPNSGLKSGQFGVGLGKELGHGRGRDQGSEGLEQVELKKAYRSALLGAHPDKNKVAGGVGAGGVGAGGVEAGAGARDGDGEEKKKKKTNEKEEKTNKKAGFTIDDIKLAYTTLSNSAEKIVYDRWLALHGDSLPPSSSSSSGNGAEKDKEREDFILGLEVLDLSDFEAGEVWVRLGSVGGSLADSDDEASPPTSSPTSPLPSSDPLPSNSHQADSDKHTEDASETDEDGKEDAPAVQVEWTRPCRCGAEKGYTIREVELEDAERRGVDEVLVGCVGCSLWVRVGFDVD